MRDRGSMLVFTVLVGLAFTLAAIAALVPLFDELGARQRAQNAADAAALAGVTGGRSAADDLAAANGAVLVVWERHGRTVTVTVSVDGRTALARATDAP
jgi:Flp pilus assembly protein TadG